jgi:hypothetical protein
VGGENGLADGAIIGESDGCSDAVGDDDDSRDTVEALVGDWVGGSGVLYS